MGAAQAVIRIDPDSPIPLHPTRAWNSAHELAVLADEVALASDYTVSNTCSIVNCASRKVAGLGMAHSITSAFKPDDSDLQYAVELLARTGHQSSTNLTGPLPEAMPESGLGPLDAMQALVDPVLVAGRDLGGPGFLAHMDPPTPWITWAMAMWTASMNQNLLHPDTAPVARDLEELVVSWLSPYYGMSGGHLVPGSTVANLTAIWAARELGAREVVTGPSSHISVAKAARLLGMPFRIVEWATATDIDDSVAVITAGTTSTGEIEPLDTARDARWRHVDAAWAGPLRLSRSHADLLDGINGADSVSLSAHKWLFQPKESAVVLFADVEKAHAAIATGSAGSSGAAYLAVPNIGILGSHGATAVPLLATLLAYGRQGVESWIDHSMALADELYQLTQDHDDLYARSIPHAGVVCWRHRQAEPSAIKANLSDDVFVSTTVVEGVEWLRSVAANPMADPSKVVAAVCRAAQAVGDGG